MDKTWGYRSGRRLRAAQLCLGLALLLGGCRPGAPPPPRPQVVVLGFDGCDPSLLRRWIDQGKLPNFQRLERLGGLWPLATSNPPQSPVAWATFNTGLDPGGHGIFDFVQRDPQSLRAVPSLTAIEAGRSRLLRDGRPFWESLEEHEVPATLLKVAAHFPPTGQRGRVLSGMGTPDLLGTYGTFTYYHEGPAGKQSLTGGQDVPVESVEGRVRASLIGPEDSRAELTACVSSNTEAAVLEIPGSRRVLKPGEWTDWLPVQFPQASGIVRFYLKSVRPFQLYASPINIDPARPAQPISLPEDYSAHLCRCCGPFYTQGMAEDSKALAAGVLDDPAYLQQSQTVFQETRGLLEQGLREFRTGFFFGYLSSTDLQSHLYWNAIDEGHPGYTAEKAAKYGRVIEDTYLQADGLLGMVLHKVDPSDPRTTVFVLSDHGFAPFRRSFDVNTWLVQQGWLRLEPGQPLQNADWSKTRVYAVGFNSLYVNLQGREAQGVIAPQDREALLAEVTRRLLALRDPQTGESAVVQVYRSQDINQGPHFQQAPDMVVGYRRNFRASWESALGQVRGTVWQDNREHWSGDHLIDPSQVPGVLLCSKKIRQADPHLRDLAPTFLRQFDIAPPSEMKGRNLLEE